MVNEVSVYKFFPYSPHDLDALSNNYLWFSRYSDFNDPFEDVYIKNVLNTEVGPYDEIQAIKFYKFLHKGQIPDHVIEETILDLKLQGKLENHFNNTLLTTFEFAKEKLHEHIQKSRVCCFAQDNVKSEEPALGNRLMWSHYSDGLRGFCIEYNRPKLIYGIYKQIGYKVGLCPMQYDDLKKYRFEDLMFSTAKNLDNPNKHSSKDKLFGSLVITKSKEWSYENEYRLIVNETNAVPITANSIVSVTVGSKMDKKKLTTLLSILRGNSEIICPVYTASIDPNTFEIKRDLLTNIE